MRRLVCRLLDTGPVLVLAAIAGAGSFTHIRQTATEHGQTGWMSWAIAVCIDLTCVMAARERQRDKNTGKDRRNKVSWPVLVLTGGIVLSLAANLAQAAPTVWGWITAATPAAAFLIAISMLERRAARPHPEPAPAASSAPVLASSPVPELVPHNPQDQDDRDGDLAPALVAFARRVADEHHARHGRPITRDALRAHLGVSNQLASDLLRTLRAA
ncbi:DUF2637 domain-containing protein [Nonomuraea cavernae]|uniref:SpdA protein n=1 Tax=Nonomuraea cavernae TaxID=2045107 RepID=A0A917ZJ44_9ACTN|nr:DUF2637 domain-containing protein [Nonomuraea cavernae]MCA2190984.1 DUF2637 domain-containing protein [Nonomuraea cavernae]GGO83611.1 SpdA protein [Nonomuraea cavernae]